MPVNYDEIEREIFEELADDFYAECDELLQTLRRDLIRLENSVDADRMDKNLLDNIYRTFHTLKGITGMINIELAVTLSHKLENYLRLLCEKIVRLTQAGLNILMSGTQSLEQLIEAHRNKQTLPDITSLLLIIEKLTESSDTATVEKLHMDSCPATLLQIDEDMAQYIQDGIQQGRQLYWFNFMPSQELSVNGINVNIIRQRLQDVGEIIKGVPSSNENGDVSFDFLVIGFVEKHLMDKWQKDGLTTIPHDFSDLINNNSDKPDHDDNSPNIISTNADNTDHPEENIYYQAPSRATSNIVRVDLSRLDDLMQMVGDLVIDRARLEDHVNQIKNTVSNTNWYMLDETIQSIEKKIRNLREGIMRVRMVQINEVFERMRFTVRDLTRDNTKKINLKLVGKETEIDKLIVERMMDPLIHMVRNSISHGIETQDQRKKCNKPQEGLICLRALTSGDMVIIEIEDDGQGIDMNTIVKKAREKNIIDAQTSVNLDNLLDILCSPGFSSKENADHASGRGVGMDVVKKAVEDLGGAITIATEKGKGTIFRIYLPLTLAIMDALIVTVGNQQFAVPKLAIQEIVEVDPDLITVSGHNEMILYRGNVLPIVRVSKLFHIEENYRRVFYVMIIQKANGFIGIAIDRIINEREIVVRSLSDVFVNLKGLSGATELGDGRVVLILDVQKLSYHDTQQSNKKHNLLTNPKRKDSMDEPKSESPTEPYILFKLEKTTYGIPGKHIKQLEMIENITPVPNVPDFVEGVVFSRGLVIPAINLRLRFGFEKIQHTIRSRLLVINDNSRTVGLIVDSAKEFVTISHENVYPPPEDISEINEKYIEGITKLENQLILLVKIDEILNLADAISLE